MSAETMNNPRADKVIFLEGNMFLGEKRVEGHHGGV